MLPTIISNLKRSDTCLDNLDKFDMNHYESTLMKSSRFKEMSEEGEKVLPTFSSLQRDVWGSLFKYAPKLKQEVDKDLTLNRQVLQNIYDNVNFRSMKEYTKLDDLASALGTIKLSGNLKDIVEEINNATKQEQEDLQKELEKAQQKQNEADAFKDALEQLQEQIQNMQDQLQGQPDGQDQQAIDQMQQKAQELKKKQSSAQRSANNANKKAEQIQQQMLDNIQQQMNNSGFQDNLNQMISNAFSQTREAEQEVNSLIGSDGAGKHRGNQTDEKTLSAKLKVFEYLEKNPALRKILKIAGNIKQTSFKKKKRMTEHTNLKQEVELGNDPERLLPSELLLYHNPATKTSFLKKFAEGECLQYSNRAKDKLGEGTVVCCKDISGSMDGQLGHGMLREEWASAVAFSLFSQANKKKRPYYQIDFNSSVKSAYKVTLDNCTNLLKTESTGGTDFYSALQRAFTVIGQEQEFKKSDIIFITDGDDTLTPDEIDEIQKWKKKYNTTILAIQLSQSEAYTEKLKIFADKVIAYDGQEELKEIFSI